MKLVSHAHSPCIRIQNILFFSRNFLHRFDASHKKIQIDVVRLVLRAAITSSASSSSRLSDCVNWQAHHNSIRGVCRAQCAMHTHTRHDNQTKHILVALFHCVSFHLKSTLLSFRYKQTNNTKSSNKCSKFCWSFYPAFPWNYFLTARRLMKNISRSLKCSFTFSLVCVRFH